MSDLSRPEGLIMTIFLLLAMTVSIIVVGYVLLSRCSSLPRRAFIELELLEDRIAPTRITWFGDIRDKKDGTWHWSEPANWSTTDTIPGPKDDVFFDSTFIISPGSPFSTVDKPFRIHSLTIENNYNFRA